MGVELIYHVMFISAVQQTDLVLHRQMLFRILFHDGLSQGSEYSSRCYIVGPYCLSIFIYNSLQVCIC